MGFLSVGLNVLLTSDFGLFYHRMRMIRNTTWQMVVFTKPLDDFASLEQPVSSRGVIQASQNQADCEGL